VVDGPPQDARGDASDHGPHEWVREEKRGRIAKHSRDRRTHNDDGLPRESVKGGDEPWMKWGPEVEQQEQQASQKNDVQ
jgi:hypothetical protein